MLEIARITRRSPLLSATMASSVCWAWEEDRSITPHSQLAVNRSLPTERQDKHPRGIISLLQGKVPRTVQGTMFQLSSTSLLIPLQARVAGFCHWRFLG